MTITVAEPTRSDSPVSNDGRGLKRNLFGQASTSGGDSPVSNDGRGLKPLEADVQDLLELIRPSAMTGVD